MKLLKNIVFDCTKKLVPWLAKFAKLMCWKTTEISRDFIRKYWSLSRFSVDSEIQWLLQFWSTRNQNHDEMFFLLYWNNNNNNFGYDYFSREVAVALQSVYQPTELTNYVRLKKQEKEEQLMELMCIVAGIRLFNRDCQRGGEGIDDRTFWWFFLELVQQCVNLVLIIGQYRVSCKMLLENHVMQFWNFWRNSWKPFIALLPPSNGSSIVLVSRKETRKGRNTNWMTKKLLGRRKILFGRSNCWLRADSRKFISGRKISLRTIY